MTKYTQSIEKYKSIATKYIEDKYKDSFYDMNVIEKENFIKLTMSLDEFTYDFFTQRDKELEVKMKEGMCEDCYNEEHEEYKKHYDLEISEIYRQYSKDLMEALAGHYDMCEKTECCECEYICQCGCGSCLFMSEEDQEGLLSEE